MTNEEHTAAHPEHLHHHFETEQQQFDSDKLGMWLFLVTEVLLFSGLFVAYAYYRANHPEIFIYAHKYLDKTLGGINTVVLITSSLTMAWAVRAAQLGQRRILILMLSLTLVGAFGFLAIKGVEYNHKWKHGLLWGQRFQPETHEAEPGHGEGEAAAGTELSVAEQNAAFLAGDVADGEVEAEPAFTPVIPEDAPPDYIPLGPDGEPYLEETNIGRAATGPEGLAFTPTETGHQPIMEQPQNVHIFFGIYFAMTGLHAIHVIAGIIAIIVMLGLAVRGHFDKGYFTPVDLTGLYWHLVDLIWIFLFPLLYLIH